MIYISEDANPILLDIMRARGFRLCLLGRSAALPEPVAKHADLRMCRLGASPGSPVFFPDDDRFSGAARSAGSTEVLSYPADAALDAAVCGRFLIHNTAITDPGLLAAARDHIGPKLELINVRQGYTKCNLAVVDDSHVITEDAGIARALEARFGAGPDRSPGIVCLLIRPGFVALPGYSRGFIGGACGLAGGTLWFNGDIAAHPDRLAIEAFAASRGVPVQCVPGPLTDIGGIIEAPDPTPR